VDGRAIVQFHTADFVTRQLAADRSVRRTAGANDSPSTAANRAREAPLINDLKTRRQTLGWSVKDVAGRCGIDEKSLSEWEGGVASPRLDAVERWAAAFGLNVAAVPAENPLRHGLRIDWDKRCIAVDGAPVRLTPMEWKALERLSWAPGELVTHGALFHHLYGKDRLYRAQSTAIRVLITKLRRLLPLRIDAQWGKGYVVSGLDPSLARAPSRGDGAADGSARREPEAAKTQLAHVSLMPHIAPCDPPIRRELVDLAEPGMRRVAAPPRRQSPCRAEELGVIERFLAERGATRCPDVATIQQSPLPTLVWDKIKRKWVRPSMTGHEAG
jgi:transcriptional regulator with XRE-family HTH domain